MSPRRGVGSPQGERGALHFGIALLGSALPSQEAGAGFRELSAERGNVAEAAGAGGGMFQ